MGTAHPKLEGGDDCFFSASRLNREKKQPLNRVLCCGYLLFTFLCVLGFFLIGENTGEEEAAVSLLATRMSIVLFI